MITFFKPRIAAFLNRESLLAESFSWPIFSGVRRITDATRRYILGLTSVILNIIQPNEINGRKFGMSF